MCESFENRRGMVSRINSKCTNTNCKHEKLLSNPRSHKKKTLNKSSVAAARHAGLGRRGPSDVHGFNGLVAPHHSSSL